MNKKSDTLDKEKTARDIYKEQNKKLDGKADEANFEAILQLIDKSINRKYFKESRLTALFEKCFQLTDPQKLMKDPRF